MPLQEDEALEALRLVAAALATAQLRHLNLSDNALGEKGVRAAAAALQPVSSMRSAEPAVVGGGVAVVPAVTGCMVCFNWCS